MATRLYLSVGSDPGVTPSLGGWNVTTGFDRRLMTPFKTNETLTNKSSGNLGNLSANQHFLIRQYVSPPMLAGNLFDNTVTVKGQARCAESAANDNINRALIELKIVSRDGNTVRVTSLALGLFGPSSSEWSAIGTAITNRRLADGDALTGSYTTVAGDRIVLEVGGQVSSAGGTSVDGTQNFGSSSGTDLAEDDTTTTANNPWFEFSSNITFEWPAKPITALQAVARASLWCLSAAGLWLPAAGAIIHG